MTDEASAPTSGSDEWQYQIRVDLPSDVASAARQSADHPGLDRLRRILANHDAVLVCQYDAFADYCSEAEENGIEHYPLYHWTRAVIEDPAKEEKYRTSFSIHVKGAEVYVSGVATALEAALSPLLGIGIVKRLARHDTNPANNPRIPRRYQPCNGPSGPSAAEPATE